MRVFKNPEQLRLALRGERQNRRSIAFVPTMGNLHAGHMALVERARVLSECVVTSVFVNPLQFDRAADLEAYPRTLERDARMLSEAKVQYLFAPEVQDMYPAPPDEGTRVTVTGISERHEGEYRPGHFTGVATVVTKLFNIVRPDIAIFGEKDYQQLQVIRKLVFDLNLPVKIVSVPTQREADGLAMSSRNGRLSAEERNIAPRLYKVLTFIERAIRSRDFDHRVLEQHGDKLLRQAGFQPEYLRICHAGTLEQSLPRDDQLVILAAVWLNAVRLIDCLPINLKSG